METFLLFVSVCFILMCSFLNFFFKNPDFLHCEGQYPMATSPCLPLGFILSLLDDSWTYKNICLLLKPGATLQSSCLLILFYQKPCLISPQFPVFCTLWHSAKRCDKRWWTGPNYCFWYSRLSGYRCEDLTGISKTIYRKDGYIYRNIFYVPNKGQICKLVDLVLPWKQSYAYAQVVIHITHIKAIAWGITSIITLLGPW